MSPCSLLLAAALSAAPAVRDGEAEAQTLHQRLAAELLASEPPAAAAPATGAPVAPPAQGTAALPSHAPVVGSAAASIPAWPALVVLAALGGVFFFARRRPSATSRVPLNRLASLPMGGRRHLVLVEVMQQRLLLGCSEKGISLLARLEAPAGAEGPPKQTAADPSARERSFRRLLEEAELSETSAPALAESRAAGEQRDLARKLRSLGRI